MGHTRQQCSTTHGNKNLWGGGKVAGRVGQILPVMGQEEGQGKVRSKGVGKGYKDGYKVRQAHRKHAASTHVVITEPGRIVGVGSKVGRHVGKGNVQINARHKAGTRQSGRSAQKGKAVCKVTVHHHKGKVRKEEQRRERSHTITGTHKMCTGRGLVLGKCVWWQVWKLLVAHKGVNVG